MAIPLLGLLLRGAMGAAAGTTRLAAMSGGAGRGLIGSVARGSLARRALRGRRSDDEETSRLVSGPFPDSMSLTQSHTHRRAKEFSDPTRLRKFTHGIEKTTFALGKFGLRTAGLTAGVYAATTAHRRLTLAKNDQAISTLRALSPKMAAIAAQRDVFNMRQGAIRGENIGDSSKRLQDAAQRHRKATQPFENFWENVNNEVATTTSGWDSSLWEWADKIGLTKMITGVNAKLLQEQGKDRGIVLNTLDGILKNGLHNDPNLMNRRPNEKPGGRM